jgi:hypothetical protein
MRRLARAAVTSVFLVAGCRPGRPAPRRDAGTAVVAPQDVPARRTATVRVLGDPGAAVSGAPQLAVDGDGAPMLATVEGTAVRVRRWSGGAWAPRGEALNEVPATGPVALATLPQGAPVVTWAERATDGVQWVRAARWDGRGWARLPGHIATPTAGEVVAQLVVACADEGPVVAAVLERTGARALHAAWWTGGQWLAAGPPSLVAAGARALRAAATRTADGGLMLGWIEAAANGVPTLQLRRWNAQARNWLPLPRSITLLVDGGSQVLALAPATGEDFFVSVAWSGGLHPLQRWDAALGEWVDEGLPLASLRQGALALGPLLTSHEGQAALAWQTPGGPLRVARRTAGAWAPPSDLADTARPDGAGLVTGARGEVFAAFVDAAGRASVRAFSDAQ